MRTTRVFSIIMASVLALAVTGCGGTSFKKDEPQTAARDFLVEALTAHNGQRACDYLTQEAQGKLASVDPAPGSACRALLDRSYLVHDGEEVDTTNAVKDLDYSAERRGDEATVTVKAQGGNTLVLRLKHDAGFGNLYEPKTPWRIIDGAQPLITGQPG